MQTVLGVLARDRPWCSPIDHAFYKVSALTVEMPKKAECYYVIFDVAHEDDEHEDVGVKGVSLEFDWPRWEAFKAYIEACMRRIDSDKAEAR